MAIGVIGVALSFGTSLPGYALLHEHLPLLSGLRNVARWGWLPLAPIAILAGFGASILESRSVALRADRHWRCWSRSKRSARRSASRRSTASRASTIGSQALGRRHRRVPVLFGSERQPERAVRATRTRATSAAAERLQQFPPRHVRSARTRAQFISRRNGAGGAGVADVTHVLVHTQDFSRRYGRAGAQRDRHDSRASIRDGRRRHQALSPEVTCPAEASEWSRRRTDRRASRRSASCSVSSRFEKQKRTVCGAAAGSM